MRREVEVFEGDVGKGASKQSMAPLFFSPPAYSPVSCSAAHLAGAARQRSLRSTHAARSSARRAAGAGNGGGAEGDGIDRCIFSRSKDFLTILVARLGSLFISKKARFAGETASKGSLRRRDRQERTKQALLRPPLLERERREKSRESEWFFLWFFFLPCSVAKIISTKIFPLSLPCCLISRNSRFNDTRSVGHTTSVLEGLTYVRLLFGRRDRG